MESSSAAFIHALQLLNSKSYEKAITLFRQDLDENPNNFLSYNNIGVAQTHLGIVKQDKSFLESAIQHFERAIAIANESVPIQTYDICEINLKWAKEELKKLK